MSPCLVHQLHIQTENSYFSLKLVAAEGPLPSCQPAPKGSVNGDSARSFEMGRKKMGLEVH